MTPAQSHPMAFEVRFMPRAGDTRTAGQPTLRASGDGYSLLGPTGEVLHRGFGPRGRRECLEAARARGILAVFS